MILLLGDSNIRDAFEHWEDDFEPVIKDKIIFEQVTTNEALKIALEKEREPQPWLVYISSILNEIAAKVGKGKPKEDVIKVVTKDQNEKVNAAALEHKNTLYVISNPFIRQDPKWIEEKLLLIKFYMNEHVKVNSPDNVAIVNEPEITAEDLTSDKVHLQNAAIKKVAEKIINDILICKREHDKTSEGMDWNETDIVLLSQKTPKTGRKRTREATEETGESSGMSKKSKEDSEMMAMMKTLMAEIRDGKSKTNIETKQIKTDVEKLKEDTTEVKQQLEKLGKQKEVDNVYTATVREDLDAVENDNMRNVVIVKKLKTKQKMPNDRTELTKIIQKAGRNLVKEIIGSDESVVFVSQLYTGKDSIKIVEGSIPPFKIVFKSKQAGMEFKEKAVQQSKEDKSALKGAYFTTQQTLATRIRTNLMWSVADKIKNKEKEIDAWVTQNLNRPMLQVKGEERYQRGYTFVNAMVKYGSKLDDKAKEETQKLAKKHFPGQVAKMFMVIKD